MQINRIIRSVFLLVTLIVWFTLPASNGHAQEPETITGNGTIADKYPLTMTFPPAGGPVTASVNWEGDMNNAGVQYSYISIFTGEFTGGDGGDVSGTFTQTRNGEGLTGGTWEGKFFADGTGSGTATADDFGVSVSWQISYSAEEFAAALVEPTQEATTEPTQEATAEPTVEAVTSETIYNTYGIRVEDSFGDDQYAQTSWTDEELGLMNDVLKELPPDLIKSMKIKRFIRNIVSIDEDGNQNPRRNGEYSICGDSPECDGSEASIRIFDNALVPTAENPDPATKFKGTILHELIHALQYNNTRDNPMNAYSTPLLYNFVDAVTTPNAGGWDAGWEYKQVPGAPPPPKWHLTSSQQPPTNYGKTNPMEDMCESVRMYMYDSQKLKDSSPLRYAFIRDEMFGGVEYEKGAQKK